MTNTLLAALLFVLGVGALGGALLGGDRRRRLLLVALAVVLWIAAALLFLNTRGAQVAEPTPTTAVDLPATTTATSAPEPTAAPTAAGLARTRRLPQRTVGKPRLVGDGRRRPRQPRSTHLPSHARCRAGVVARRRFHRVQQRTG